MYLPMKRIFLSATNVRGESKKYSAACLADELCENEDGLTTIGRKRIICFPAVTASKLRFTVVDSKACPLISNVGVYYAPEI